MFEGREGVVEKVAEALREVLRTVRPARVVTASSALLSTVARARFLPLASMANRTVVRRTRGRTCRLAESLARFRIDLSTGIDFSIQDEENAALYSYFEPHLTMQLRFYGLC